jgi:UDPglucose 6-dehydrogenase
MKDKNIGIIGQGFVGTAIREKFKDQYRVFTYDKLDTDKSLIYHKDEISGTDGVNLTISLNTLIQHNDIIFVCVPTPMYEDGECDTSIVESVIDDISNECEVLDCDVKVIIKSTVPPGTTNRLNSISNRITVVFSPEFLTEANATEDFDKQTRIVLGLDYAEVVEPIKQLFLSVFPKADIIIINSIEAEMTKYMTNLFLATKVSFFNDMYSICEKLNIDYNNVIEATLHDPRIGKSHYDVPGPDGDRGFGGHCFPKDLSAMLHIADANKLAVPTLTGVDFTNKLVRKNKDWEKMEGRAVSKRIEESADDLQNLPNVILVESTSFSVNSEDPLHISYSEELPSKKWIVIKCRSFLTELNAPLEDEILYMFSKKVGYYLELKKETEPDLELDEINLISNQQFED